MENEAVATRVDEVVVVEAGSGTFGRGVSLLALGLLVGAAVGVAVGMLATPWRGADTRQRLTTTTRALSGRARQLSVTAREGAGRVVQSVRPGASANGVE